MKAVLSIAASAAALGVAACYPPPQQLTRLDCPETQGELTRIGQAADGRSCTYVGEGGAEVSLRIVEVEGGVDATLARLEDELRSYLPPQPPAAPAGVQGAEAAPAESESAAAPASGSAGASADAAQKASAEAKSDASAPLSVEAEAEREGGDVVRVDLPGIRIHADEAKDEAKISIGEMTIDASDSGAVIRTRKDARLRGEAFAREKRGVRARLVIAGDQVGPDWRYLAYEVSGRKTGPLAVAVVRAKDGDGDDVGHGDITRLVRRNGGA